MSPETPLAGYGGRRFALTVGASAVYTALLVFEILTEDAFVMLQMMTVGAYMGASSVQHFARETRGNNPPAAEK